MPPEDTKILEFNQYPKFDKAPFIVYANLECIIEKIDRCKNSPENSSEHIPSGFSMSTKSFFKSIENKHDLYRGKDCMKKVLKFWRKNEVINQRAAGMMRKWKNQLYMSRKFWK